MTTRHNQKGDGHRHLLAGVLTHEDQDCRGAENLRCDHSERKDNRAIGIPTTVTKKKNEQEWQR